MDADVSNEPTEECASLSELCQHWDKRIEECDKMIAAYWEKYPELYQAVQLSKQQALAKQKNKQGLPTADDNNVHDKIKIDALRKAIVESSSGLFLNKPLRGAPLRARIRENYDIIRERTAALNAGIVPRTAAHNRKNPHQTIEEEQAHRADAVDAQIKAWRSLLPSLIRKFSKIPDVRRAGSVKHTLSVLMMFGLFAFIFRLSSRREMNRELTGPVIFEHLKTIFPEMDSMPHADTLARVLEILNPKDIETIHVGLIKDLIKKKKFRTLLIHNCLPITVDGTQKLYRDGLLQEQQWCERNVGKPEEKNKQQYIYAIEANITLKNGLSIPLMTEYLYRENNELMNSDEKQDSETTAFERMAERLKQYFPRLKLIFFMDALYATQPVMGLLNQYHWDYIIRLPKKKLTDFAAQLNQNKSTAIPIPNQAAYRKRKQNFHWQNDIPYGHDWQLIIHLVACTEEYEDVDKKTGKIVPCYSEHAWISSVRMTIKNAHELLNLGARKKELIEDNMNTEKHRGYHYKHAFSYNWNAMQGFHYLMRLGHAINALSEFTKKLKQYIKTLGCSATLKLIKETLFSPWLPTNFYEAQSKKVPQLRLQLE